MFVACLIHATKGQKATLSVSYCSTSALTLLVSTLLSRWRKRAHVRCLFLQLDPVKYIVAVSVMLCARSKPYLLKLI